MKLRNKQTGEIKEWDFGNWYQTILNPGNKEKYECNFNDFINRAVKFREEWEDYEEPKRHWIIDTMNDRVEDFDMPMAFNESIGNYFSSKEEAEKAVEKLKAFKRLKDNGMIKYSFHKEKSGIDLDFYTLTILAPRDRDSLDLLFGGEE